MFREHAALTAFENDGTRPLDLGALASLSDDDYDALEPVQWPRRPRGAARQGGRLFAEGGFPTPDGRARLRADALARRSPPRPTPTSRCCSTPAGCATSGIR